MANPLKDLVALLQAQCAAHDELLAQIAAHRQSLRKGTAESIVAALAAQNELVQRISEMEKQRLRLAAELTLSINPKAKRPMTLVELFPHLDAASAQRLTPLRDTLRDKAEQVRRELSPLRTASESLLRTMQGMLREMSSAANAGLYVAKQSRKPVTPVMSTFSATA